LSTCLIARLGIKWSCYLWVDNKKKIRNYHNIIKLSSKKNMKLYSKKQNNYNIIELQTIIMILGFWQSSLMY